jgi:hypothetical protein
VRRVCALLRANTLPNAQKKVALAKHASAFTQGNDLPWNPAKHSSVLKVLNKLPEVYHIRRGLSSKAVGPFIPGLKARGFLAPLCKSERSLELSHSPG